MSRLLSLSQSQALESSLRRTPSDGQGKIKMSWIVEARTLLSSTSILLSLSSNARTYAVGGF
jgi:hypothetical protein